MDVHPIQGIPYSCPIQDILYSCPTLQLSSMHVMDESFYVSKPPASLDHLLVPHEFRCKL